MDNSKQIGEGAPVHGDGDVAGAARPPKTSVLTGGIYWGRILLLRELPAILLVLAVCVLIQWRGLNYVSGAALSSDKGLFASSAYMINQGALLYRDIWDHKPVGIHFLGALALAWLDDDPARALWRLQWIHSIFLLAVVAGLVRVWFGSYALGLLGAWIVSLILYHQHIYLGGHFAGEYGSSIVAAGALLLGLLIRRNHGDNRWVQQPPGLATVAFAGFTLSLATQFKEPFLLDSIPLFGWLVLMTARSGREALRLLAAFVIGAVLPVVLIAAYFLIRGGLGAWLGALTYNFAYMRNHAAATADQGSRILRSADRFHTLILNGSTPLMVLGTLGLVAAVIPSRVRQTAGVVALIPVWLGFSFWGASLGGHLYHHYYMQCVVPYALLCVSGVALLAEWARRLPVSSPLLALSLLAAIVYLEVPRITVRPGASDSFVISALRRHQFHLVRRPPESVDNYILSVTTDRDSIWSQCYRNSGIYAQLRRRPASRYHYALDHLFIDSLGSTRAEKLQLLADEFRTNKPKIVLTEDRNPEALPVLADSGLATLLREDYTSTPLRRFGAIVWQRKPNS